MTDITFGKWLKLKRKASDLTQQQLADQVGCSAIAIRKIEAEERRPSQQIAERIAEIFHIPENEKINFLRFARGSWDFATGGIYEDAPWRMRDLHDAILHSNLPTPLTSFVGREKEVQEVVRLLENHRLVTLKGPGGVGKTRLAIQSSTQCAGTFANGVCWVELAALTDASLVPQAVANSLGLRELSNQSLDEMLLSVLKSKQLLLVLDNCEHLIKSCAQLANKLLHACPNLKILATSREPLGVTGENVWVVPILSLPNPQKMSLVDLLMQYEGIRLFVDRARAAKTDFQLTEQNAIWVAQICIRLDGMPLAIELAAVRVMMMSVSEIAKRLDDRFSLLTSGSRSDTPRHQTLSAAIDWSYELLSPAEQVLFNRLSVFAGGFTLGSAEEVTSGGEVSTAQVLDLLRQLINKSLVIVSSRSEDPEIETRYSMMESIREYGHKKLTESGNLADINRRHSDFFISAAEQVEEKLKGPQQLIWLDQFEAEHDNFRAALHWAQEMKDVDALLHLSGALFWFWFRRAFLVEGRAWLERSLELAGDSLFTADKAKVLYGAAYLTRAQGDFATAQKIIEESINIWKRLGENGKQGGYIASLFLAYLLRDKGETVKSRSLLEDCVLFFKQTNDHWNFANSLMMLGLVLRDQEDFTSAWSMIEESVQSWREQGEIWGLAEALHHLGLVAYRQGNYPKAYSLMEEILSIRRKMNDRLSIAYSIHNLGVFTLARGDLEKAIPYFEQDLILFNEVGDKSGVALALQYQGLLARHRGDDVQARLYFEQGLKLAQESGPIWISSNYLLWLADLALDASQFERAVTLCSAAKKHLDSIASFWDAFETANFERIMTQARASLEEAKFMVAEKEGQAITLEQAILFALK